MDISRAQYCCSNQPFYEMLVPSRSEPGVIHRVTVPLPGDARTSWYCSCKGWTFRGTCSHLNAVAPCRWNEIDGPETQTPQQKSEHICPRCLGNTFEDLIAI